MPLVVHNWADLQSVHGFRCYDNIHVRKLIVLYTANAYNADREMSASACTRSMPGLICCEFVVQQAVGFCGMLRTCCTAVRFVVELYIDTLRHSSIYRFVTAIYVAIGYSATTSPEQIEIQTRIAHEVQNIKTRHRAHTSMYSLSFRVHVMLP